MKKYQESSNITLANNLKLDFKPSQFEDRLKRLNIIY